MNKHGWSTLDLNTSIRISSVFDEKGPPSPRPYQKDAETYQVEWYDLHHRKATARVFLNTMCAREIKEEISFTMHGSMDIEQFYLKVRGVDHYITNETIPLRRVAFIQLCKKGFVRPRFQLVRKPDVLPDGNDLKKYVSSHLQLVTDITLLVGESLVKSMESQRPEVCAFRARFAKRRLEKNEEWELKKQKLGVIDAEKHTLVYTNTEPIPVSLPKKIRLLIYMPSSSKMKTVLECEPNMSLLAFKEFVFKKYVALEQPEMACSVDFVIKVRGLKEYLIGDYCLLDFDYIRRCLNKQLQIKLSFVPISNLDLEIPEYQDSMFDRILATDFEGADRKGISNLEMKGNFKVRLIGVERLNFMTVNDIRDTAKLYVMMELYHGQDLIEEIVSPRTPISSTPVWNEIMHSKIAIQDLPRATRLCFSIFASDGSVNSVKDIPLGWINVPVFDHVGHLITGKLDLRIWADSRANPIGTLEQNMSTGAPILILEFENYKEPVHHSIDSSPLNLLCIDPPNDQEEILLSEIAHRDPLLPLTTAEKEMVFRFRHYLVKEPKLLTRFLESTNWVNNQQVREAVHLIRKWSSLDSTQVLHLLDSKFADPFVRSFAVETLGKLNDGDLSVFLLQLTQVLKHEPYHDSALAQMLIERALNNRNGIGYNFFYFLRSEMHIPEISERYGLILETYLRGCGSRQRKELMKQNELLTQLSIAADRVKSTPLLDKPVVLLQELNKIQFSEPLLLPIDPRFQVKGLIREKCKYLDSKKQPLFLYFENAEDGADPIVVIFKSGDDLRQDVLTLQMIRLMDNLWKGEGLDLRLLPYKCTATGRDQGMIEVVLQSETTAEINKESGGSMSVWKPGTLLRWLQSHNPSEYQLQYAIERFILSTAGYCVATFVLGIGDRHNDNIMMTKNGNLFHIDFGHFLGNYKTKYGFKRERAPFVFTPQYLSVMGGKDSAGFERYVQTCKTAYNILRKKSTLFINLFEMMLSTGIPELQRVEDIYYIRDAFLLGKTDEESASRFEKNIYIALNTVTTQINDMIHVLVHPSK